MISVHAKIKEYQCKIRFFPDLSVILSNGQLVRGLFNKVLFIFHIKLVIIENSKTIKGYPLPKVDNLDVENAMLMLAMQHWYHRHIMNQALP